MVTLNHQNSPITRAERLKLNENWVTIVEQFVKIQRQFNIVTGGKEVDELLQRIESAIASSEASISDINGLITDVRALIVTTNETIASANTAASNANTKATEAQQATQAANTATASATQAIANIERIMGEYGTRVNAAITNSENATQAANTATQESITAKEQTEQATTEAQTATTAANESATRANDSAQNADTAASNANQVAQNMSGYNKPIEDFTLGKTFLKHQAARFNGSTYRAKVETTGNPLPVDPAVENDWWALEAKRGTDGEGSVGSVNGKLPDDSGNVQIDVGGGTWDEIAGKPTTFPPSAHKHAIDDVTGLRDALNNAGNIPDASLTTKGLTMLETATNSNSEATAATPKSVKTVMTKATATDGKVTILENNINTVEQTLTTHMGEKGKPNGYASLDANGKVPSQQLNINIVNASTSEKGIVQLNDGITSTSTTQAATANAVKKVNDKVGTLTNLKTTNKTDLVLAVNELFTSVSNGKSLVANAITGKGVPTASDAEFATMASNIGLIKTGGGELVKGTSVSVNLYTTGAMTQELKGKINFSKPKAKLLFCLVEFYIKYNSSGLIKSDIGSTFFISKDAAPIPEVINNSTSSQVTPSIYDWVNYKLDVPNIDGDDLNLFFAVQLLGSFASFDSTGFEVSYANISPFYLV